jgi:hypothetical protein
MSQNRYPEVGMVALCISYGRTSYLLFSQSSLSKKLNFMCYT